MIRGLYTATTGMLTQEIKMDVISNNLANVNTTGFKGEATAMRAFPQMFIHRINDTYLKTKGVEGEMDLRPMIGMAGVGAIVDEIATDFQAGSVQKTDNPFDLAIMGMDARDVFFKVQTPFGERLTRAGDFTRNHAGYLVTQNGYLVLGENGPIRVTGDTFQVSKDGHIFTIDQTLPAVGTRKQPDPAMVDRLQLAVVQDLKTLQKRGENLYAVPAELPQPVLLKDLPQEKQAFIEQGHLEGSNVNAVLSLRDMIDVMRKYESNSKMVQQLDTIMGKAVNEIARV